MRRSYEHISLAEMRAAVEQRVRHDSVEGMRPRRLEPMTIGKSVRNAASLESRREYCIDKIGSMESTRVVVGGDLISSVARIHNTVAVSKDWTDEPIKPVDLASLPEQQSAALKGKLARPRLEGPRDPDSPLKRPSPLVDLTHTIPENVGDVTRKQQLTAHGHFGHARSLT
jgi:hypothetical protein